MNDILIEIREYIKKGYFINEENVRFSLVSRILQELGWDIWNPKEVATEFNTVPNEDKSRVDIALFDNSPTPSVFIEVKALGKLELDLAKHEIQLRDYNRNNTAPFSIITDGQKWRFYYSQTGGEFSQKCFKDIDLLVDDYDDLELSLDTFLSKEEIRSGKARNEAETYLRLSQKQRVMEDAFPQARRHILEPPFPSLPAALINIVGREGYSVSDEEANRFIEKQGAKKQKSEKTVVKTQRSPQPVVATSTGDEPVHYASYRKQMSKPGTLPFKIKDYLRKCGSIKHMDLMRVCVEEFGSTPASGSISATIKVLEVDGFITRNGRGDSKTINWV